MYVDMAARIGELGRQPFTSKKFFDKYQDRILFGTDATPHGDEFPQQVFNDQLYEIYYRFMETEDEYFDYAPAKIPPQGRWRIYGINLLTLFCVRFTTTTLHGCYDSRCGPLLRIAVLGVLLGTLAVACTGTRVARHVDPSRPTRRACRIRTRPSTSSPRIASTIRTRCAKTYRVTAPIRRGAPSFWKMNI